MERLAQSSDENNQEYLKKRKKFCDAIILEKNVPDKFLSVGLLAKRCNALLKLIAPISQLPRSGYGVGRILRLQ